MAFTITGLKVSGAPRLVDISHWQSYVNGEKLVNAGIVGAIIKAGEVWINYAGQPAVQDEKHDWSVGEFKRAHLFVGNYYFWHPKAGASKQAKHYWEISKDYLFNLPPIIDVEQFDGISDKAEIARQLKAMLDETEILFGRKPVIYINAGKWTSVVGNPSWGKDYLFWVAQYNETMSVQLPENIRENTILWQYTDKLALPGLVPLDGNFWLKSEAEFVEFAHSVVNPPTPQVYTKLEITCNFLRGRTRPIYVDSTKKCIFEMGQILSIVQPMTVHIEEDSGIPWVEVKIPEAECTVWISSNPAYTKLLI